MRVVEDEHHRGALHREVGEHPVEAVAQALLVGRGTLGRGAQAERGTDDRVPTPQLGAEFRLRDPGELGLQELAGDVEGHALFLVAAARGQDRAALGRGAPPYLGEERGLADSGASGEGEERAAGPLGCFGSVLAQTGELVQRLVGGGEFTLPFEECPSAAYSALSHHPPPGHGGAVHAGSGCVP